MKPSEAIQVLQKLIEPCSDVSLSLDNALQKKIDSFSTELEKVSICEPSGLFSQQRKPLEKYAWWNFVRLVMRGLSLLKSELLAAPTDVDRLLSVSQKKTLTSSLEMVVSLGILAHLPPGVGVAIECRSANTSRILTDSGSELSSLMKFYCVEYTTNGLLSLFEEETMKDSIVSRYLGDLFAGLFHILLFQDPADVLPTFGPIREGYKKRLSEIMENINQPSIVRELMIMFGNKECPPKLGRALRGFLTERLMADGGVVATVKAILDVVGLASDSPRHAHNVSVLARLIVTPHTKDPEGYYRQICPEVISLLTSPEPHFVQVSVMCLRSLHGSKPDLFSRYFLDPMVRPLREPSGEGEVSTCVDRLYNCFAIPSSEMWSLPKRKLVPLAGPLFQLHFKVCRSVCKLKSKAEDLAWNCLREAEGAELEAVLEAAILTGGGIGFEFGGEGGVVSVTTANPPEFEEASDNLLDLVAVHDSEGRVKARLFNKSLQCLADCSTGLSWRLLAAKLLSVLSIEPQVYDAVNRDPKDLIAFLKTLLEQKIESSDPEIISIGLMVLGAVLGDTTAAPGRDWTLFSTLAAPLRTLKDLPGMDNLQLKMLAEETYCLILTHGVVTKDVLSETARKPTTNQLIEEVVDAKEVTGGGVCDQAIKEACDPLLPVRAHALRVLAKLVLTGDLTAKIKKQTILCLFKENLKDSDSYLYLSAVEGLASMGSVFPEEVLLALLEQYVACKETELRLKVGEVLIRVTRNMGELVYNYKAELLNAMLHGCRDPEPLVRSSSLSNLGELCKILAFHIGVFTIEIFDCVQSIFLNDKAPEARRAAIMVLTLLLKGLGTSALSVLEPVLLEMYRGLKKAYVLEKDDVARLQAQLALEEISALTKQYLMPEQSFNKRIYVLDPPHS